MPRNLPLFLSGNYLNFLRAQAKTLQAAARCLPDMVAVFADSAGENEKIYSLEQGNVGANRFSNGNREDIQRKTCASVSARAALFEHLYIALARREREQTTVKIEHFFQLVELSFSVRSR